MTFILGFVVGMVVGIGGLVAFALWRSSKAEQAIRRYRREKV